MARASCIAFSSPLRLGTRSQCFKSHQWVSSARHWGASSGVSAWYWKTWLLFKMIYLIFFPVIPVPRQPDKVIAEVDVVSIATVRDSVKLSFSGEVLRKERFREPLHRAVKTHAAQVRMQSQTRFFSSAEHSPIGGRKNGWCRGGCAIMHKKPSHTVQLKQ